MINFIKIKVEMGKICESKKGVAFLIVVNMVFMLAVLSSAILRISSGHFGTTYHQIHRARATYAAEAAMQHVLARLRLAQPGTLYDVDSMTFPFIDPSPPTVFDPNYNYTTTVVILQPGDTYQIVAGEWITCPGPPQNPSDYCIFCRVDF